MLSNLVNKNNLYLFFLFQIFSSLPNFLKYWLIKIYFIIVGKYKVDPCCIHATIELIHPAILKNVFDLANDEMDKICGLDKEVNIFNFPSFYNSDHEFEEVEQNYI